jgi:hypothetical protein
VGSVETGRRQAVVVAGLSTDGGPWCVEIRARVAFVSFSPNRDAHSQDGARSVSVMDPAPTHVFAPHIGERSRSRGNCPANDPPPSLLPFSQTRTGGSQARAGRIPTVTPRARPQPQPTALPVAACVYEGSTMRSRTT